MLFSTRSVSLSRMSRCAPGSGASLWRGCRCPTGACLVVGGARPEVPGGVPGDPGAELDCAKAVAGRTMLAANTSAAIDPRDICMTGLLLGDLLFQRGGRDGVPWGDARPALNFPLASG